MPQRGSSSASNEPKKNKLEMPEDSQIYTKYAS